MNIKIISIFLFLISFSQKCYSQFNTVVNNTKTKNIQLSTEQEMEIPTNSITADTLFLEKKTQWNARRYLSLPIDSMVVTSKYGMRKDPITGVQKFHGGVDLKGNNDYVYSVMPGKVIRQGKSKTLGNHIYIQHGDFISIYAHLYSILVNSKQLVDAGQPIGISGNTGRSTGEHLHFEMKYKGKSVDPQPFLEYTYKLMIKVKKELTSHLNTIQSG